MKREDAPGQIDPKHYSQNFDAEHVYKLKFKYYESQAGSPKQQRGGEATDHLHQGAYLLS